jgi:hypothetical protein
MSEPNIARISPLLALLQEALDSRSSGGDPQEGAALVALGQLARLRIPLRGALPMSDDQLFNAIDDVGVRHFDLGPIKEAVNRALSQIEPSSTRDEIEVSIDHLCAVLNVVYFDAGLAFGITLADLRSV